MVHRAGVHLRLLGFAGRLVGGGAIREIQPAFTAAGDWEWIGRHPDGRVSFLGSRSGKFGFFTVSPGGDVSTLDLGVSTSAEEQPRQRDLQQDAVPMGPRSTTLLLEVRSVEGVWNLWRVEWTPGRWRGHAWSG